MPRLLFDCSIDIDFLTVNGKQTSAQKAMGLRKKLTKVRIALNRKKRTDGSTDFERVVRIRTDGVKTMERVLPVSLPTSPVPDRSWQTLSLAYFG